MNRVIKKINENFKIGEPIFAREILELNKDISRQMVYKYLVEGIKTGYIKRGDGYYYIPKEEIVCGIEYDNSPCYVEVVNKKYLRNKDKVYGVYSGRTLENKFNISEQVPFVEEIVSNKTSKIREEKMIGKNKIILRRPYVKIDNSNVKEYTVMQLFNDTNIDLLKKRSFLIKNYIKKNGITKERLVKIGKRFPQKALKKLNEVKIYE